MKKACNKNQNTQFKHANDKFNMEVARELKVDMSNRDSNFTTTKIIYAYELGLRDTL